MHLRRALAVMFFLTGSAFALAELKSDLPRQLIPLALPAAGTKDSLLLTRDRHPQYGRDNYESSITGLHVSTGAERSFIGYVMNPNATGLLVVDTDLNILNFIRINSALLAISISRGDYRFLRYDARATDWTARVELLEREDLNALGFSRKTFAQIKGLIHQPGVHSLWRELNRVFVESEKPRYPKFIDYQFNLEFYTKLATAVRQGNLAIYRVDMLDPISVERLFSRLSERGHRIGLMDLGDLLARSLNGREWMWRPQIYFDRTWGWNFPVVETLPDQVRQSYLTQSRREFIEKYEKVRKALQEMPEDPCSEQLSPSPSRQKP